MADSKAGVSAANGSNGAHALAAAPPVARGRYAKFTGSMDVLLLEALRVNNPFTAKHGTRLHMWKNVARIVGEETYQNPDAYSWHSCRDRVTALMKMYADGKHDKLFRFGTDEENARKADILREISACIAHKAHKAGARSPPAESSAEDAAAAPDALAERASPAVYAAASPSVFTIAGSQKRRRVDAPAAAAAPADGGDAFRARVLALIESKVQFDMEQRIKETELREQEFELQKRFLEYLQSK